MRAFPTFIVTFCAAHYSHGPIAKHKRRAGLRRRALAYLRLHICAWRIKLFAVHLSPKPKPLFSTKYKAPSVGVHVVLLLDMAGFAVDHGDKLVRNFVG